MAFNKVWWHIAANCGGCSGIVEAWRQLDDAGIPFVASAVNDAGKILEASSFSRATLIYRDVRASTVDPPDYVRDPAQEGIAYWEATKLVLPQSVVSLKSRCWIELLNEPGKEGDQANWVGWLMYHMAVRATSEGFRVMGPGWSSGTPEPEHWLTPGWQAYLRLCAEKPEQVAISLHEYSLTEDIHHQEGWHIGRFVHLLDACEQLSLPVPKIFITECGWTDRSMPPDAQAKEDIAYLANLYSQHRSIQSAHLWTLQSGAGNGNLPSRLNSLMPWLTEYGVSARFPDPEEDLPQPTTTTNLLTNGGFEEGWYHPEDENGYPIPELQLPVGWELKWRGSDWDNPYHESDFVRPEIRTLPKSQLPPAEQSLFVREGGYCVKAFKGYGALYFTFLQSVALTPGTKYKLNVPVFADIVATYVNNQKVWSQDPNAGRYRIRANQSILSAGVDGWQRLYAGQWNEIGVEVVPDAPTWALKIDFMLPFPLPQNGIFADGWSLVEVATEPTDPPPAEEKHKAIIVILPQGATVDDAVETSRKVHANRHTTTYSHDDAVRLLTGGNERSLAKVVHPEQQPNVIEMIEELGYAWEELLLTDTASPLTGLILSHPLSYRYMLTSGFNAARSYGNGLHEGCDYDVIGGQANNAAEVRCCYDGVVVKAVDSSGGYGKYVQVQHTRHGKLFYTWYCHLDAIVVDVNDVVPAGSVLGEIGSSGNADGEHLHLNLTAPGFGLPGYVVDNVVNPEPYMAPGRDTLPSYIPPSTGIDLLPYLRGDGRLYEMRHLDGRQERFQTQVDDLTFYQTKNAQWEEFFFDDQFIWRDVDTSPGPDSQGRQRFYTQREPGLFGARWCPRRMSIGQAWTNVRNHYVQFYQKSNCAPLAEFSGEARNRITLVARHSSKTWNGITVLDVIEMTDGFERWFFARNFGLVAWSNGSDRSEIAEVHTPGARPNNVREVISCLQS